MTLKPINLLPTTDLLLGNWEDSKKLLVRKNYLQELEFINNNETKNLFNGSCYLDFILNP